MQDGKKSKFAPSEKELERIEKDKEELENLSSKSGDIITLYAIWKVNSYQITFLDYDESIIQQNELDYDSEIVIPEDPIRKGYTFTGWDKELSIVKEELVITALYDINSYDISYLLNGGTLNEAPPKYNVESEDIIIPSPEKIFWTGADDTGFTVLSVLLTRISTS